MTPRLLDLVSPLDVDALRGVLAEDSVTRPQAERPIRQRTGTPDLERAFLTLVENSEVPG